MSKPYGKIPRARKPSTAKGGSATFKIKLRGEDGDCLSMQEIRDGLFEAARRLQSDASCHRAKWITVYLTILDRDGKPVLPDPSGEWDIRAYKCAADEHGL